MAKVVLLGANGQLGSDIVRIFTNTQHELVALTRDKFDINNVTSLDNLANIDYIINCIAYTNVDGAENNYTLANQINAAFTYDLSRYCNSNNIVLIHISTDYVFAGDKDRLLQESDNVLPVNNYGLTKLNGEILVSNYHDKYFIF